MISGAFGAAVNGGNILKGALLGGIAAAAFSAIGNHFSNLSDPFSTGAVHEFGGNWLTSGQIAQQITAHAIVGGVLSVLQGGKFGSGFIAAGITKGFTNVELGAAGDLSSAGEYLAGTVVAAVIGGTASALTGGKFANGANTAAFQFLFNATTAAIKRANQAFDVKGHYAKLTDAGEMVDKVSAYSKFLNKLDNMDADEISEYGGEVSALANIGDVKAARNALQMRFDSMFRYPMQREVLISGGSYVGGFYVDIGVAALELKPMYEPKNSSSPYPLSQSV